MFFESCALEKDPCETLSLVVRRRNQVKGEKSLAPSILRLIAICSLALLPEFVKAQDCFIRLYANDNVNYLEVTVDTRGMIKRSS
jgi:hypothetical protein